MNGFKLYVSDGAETVHSRGTVWQVDGRNIVWDQVADVKNDHTPPLLNFDITFPPRRVRYIFLHHFYGSGWYFSRGAGGGGRIFEMQIFGGGSIPGVTLTSPMIDLGTTKNVTKVSWKGDFPGDTRLLVRTRTGDNIAEIKRYYNRGGKEITKGEYDQLPRFQRGEVQSIPVPTPDWSDWSPVYARSGDRFLSPSPRRYALIEATMLSEDPTVSPTLDALSLTFSNPVANVLFGDVKPNITEPGTSEAFLFSIRPVSGPQSTGFDRVMMTTPNRADSVRVRIDGKEVEPSVVTIGEDSVMVGLPIRVVDKTVEVAFRCMLFDATTIFKALVADSRTPDAWQRVEPDPARKNSTMVQISSVATGEELITNVSFTPLVITPNGDGVNDRLEVGFTVLKLQQPRRIIVRIHDLSGRTIRELYNDLGSSGNYTGIAWDGRQEDGTVVPPGTYICRTGIGGDTAETTITRIVGVSY
ncbi:MAG: hypothetical protein HY709_09990 [Candidatus Latescibacteria bacterium]|nr:hypothetical protein [Candidatus Latescibacterota bacterium]